MAKPVGLDVDTGSDASSVKTESSPLQEKRSQFSEGCQGSSSSSHSRPLIARQESLQGNVSPSSTVSPRGKELRRQYSLTDTKRQREEGGVAVTNQKISGCDSVLSQMERTVPLERGDEGLQKSGFERPRSEKSGERQQRSAKDGSGMETGYADLRMADRSQRETGYMMERRLNDSSQEGRHSARDQGGKDRNQDWVGSRDQLEKEDARRRASSRSR